MMTSTDEKEAVSVAAPEGFRRIIDELGQPAYVSSGSDDGSSDDCTRLQAGPDSALDEVRTAKDVWKKIEEVKSTQGEYRNADLYPRQWEPVDVVEGATSSDTASAAKKHTFTVLQFNVLAEGLSSGPDVTTPFPTVKADSEKERGNCFGGFTELKNPEISLDFNLRRWRLIEEIVRTHDGKDDTKEAQGGFDILAMQEVDRFHGFFQPILAKFGYKGIFETKSSGGPGTELGWYSDGCALFWKEDTFELLSDQRRGFSVGGQVCIIATLRHLATNRKVVVAVTHLKAKENDENEKVRTTQAKELLGYASVARLEAGMDVPIVIAGDFNTVPSGGKGNLTCIKSVLSKESVVSGLPHLVSAYPVDPLKPGFFTTLKTRGEKTVKRVIDYIFYTGKKGDADDEKGGIRCTHTLDVPLEGDMEPEGLPGFRYPSDHFMIAAMFELDDTAEIGGGPRESSGGGGKNRLFCCC